MSRIDIELPEADAAYVREQVAGSRFADVSEFMLSLVRQHQAAHSPEEIERKLAETLAKGGATEFTRADWDELRTEVIRRHAARTGR